MLKADLRKEYLKRRQRLSAGMQEDLSNKIARQFFDFLPEHLFTIHIYLPIREKQEVDTWPVIRKLWDKGINTVVPMTDIGNTTLTSWVLTPETTLQDNIWGIPEPQGADYVDNEVIELVILPLLVFDENGYRVGYGKGFYDRFLSTFEAPPVKVGLSYFDPVPSIADISDYDIRMDYCITPSRLFVWKND